MNVLEAMNKKRELKQKTQAQKGNANQKKAVDIIPYIALVTANLLVISLDYRVIEAVYKLTNNVALAVFALFTSGAMFILWFDILYQYLLASEWQKGIALSFSGISLISAGVFSFLDYGLSVDLGNGNTLPVEANALFAGMVILTIANGAGLFWWYIIDAQVSRKSAAAKQIAENDYDAQNIDIANTLLDKVDTMLAKRKEIEIKYGAQAVDSMVASLMGLEELLGVDVNGDGMIGNRPMTAKAAEVPLVQLDPKDKGQS